MKVALIQLSPHLGDLGANLALIRAAVTAAAERGAELALLPELALTGYRLRDLVPEVALRLDRPGPILDGLKQLSTMIPLVCGLVEESPERRFYNAAVYLDGGEIGHVHRKCYLPNYGLFDEAMDFAPGPRLSAFDTRFGRLGILICEDAWHPAAATVLTQDGATALLVPSVSPLRGLATRPEMDSAALWRLLLESTARFHTVPVLYCGRVGFEDGLAYAGGSYAVGPGGEPLAPPLDRETATLIVQVDPERTRTARAAYPLLRDERPELIARELRRIIAERGGEPAP